MGERVCYQRHLLAEACRHLKGWHGSLEAPPRLSINVSAREVQSSDVCGEVKRAAATAGLAPSSLQIEFTETAVLADPRRAAEVATCLRDAGATVALDDFGTGYSALTHLRELPIDRVKIDRSFVASCLTDRSAAAILLAVTNLELIRSCGHLTIGSVRPQQGSPDAQITSTVYARVPPGGGAPLPFFRPAAQGDRR